MEGINDKIYKGEVAEIYTVKYALVDRGDGIRCAWCDKKNPSKKHLEKHDKHK